MPLAVRSSEWLGLDGGRLSMRLMMPGLDLFVKGLGFEPFKGANGERARTTGGTFVLVEQAARQLREGAAAKLVHGVCVFDFMCQQKLPRRPREFLFRGTWRAV